MPVSELLFQRLEDSPEDVLDTFYKLLGAFWSSSRLVKTLIPYSTSSKNHAINGPTSKTPLRSALEAFWNGWRRPWSGFSIPFWSPLAALTGDPVNKIRFFVASEGIGAFSCFQMVSGDAFGWCLVAFLVVWSCFFRSFGRTIVHIWNHFWLLGVASLVFFERIIVHPLCYAVCIFAPSIVPPSQTSWRCHGYFEYA